MSKHSGKRPILIGTTTPYDDIISELDRMNKDMLRSQYKGARTQARFAQVLFWLWIFLAMLEATIVVGLSGVIISLGYCAIAYMQLHFYKKHSKDRDRFLMEIMAE
jgi:hypothetical protein